MLGGGLANVTVVVSLITRLHYKAYLLMYQVAVQRTQAFHAA